MDCVGKIAFRDESIALSRSFSIQTRPRRRRFNVSDDRLNVTPITEENIELRNENVVIPNENVVQDNTPRLGNRIWSGLGTTFDRPTSAREALKIAHMDFECEKRPIFLANGTKIKDRMAVVRVDNSMPLGIVGRKYEVVQNSTVTDVIDNLLGVSSATVEAVGHVGYAKLWFLCRLPEMMEVANGDPIAKYLLITSSHDSSLSLNVCLTNIRVFCQNVMHLALSRSDNRITLKHTKNILKSLSQARNVLDRSGTYFERARAFFEDLSKATMTREEVNVFVNRIFPERNGKITPQLETSRQSLLSLINGNGLIGFNDENITRWRALNAITQFLDRSVPTRGNTNRLQNSLLDVGLTARLRARAVQLLQKPTLN
jgi:phage/plasmid-like protein (TIGR03299 family)